MEFFGKKSDGTTPTIALASPVNQRSQVRQSSWTLYGGAGGGRKNSIVWTESKEEDNEYDSWGLDIFSKSSDELCSICLNFFGELNLVERLCIEEEALQNLIVSIRDT